MNRKKTSKELKIFWYCKICGDKADYNDVGTKLCTKHWCEKKGYPHGKRKS